ncbi:hypothetical protein DFR24_0661 [Panacagrimonas perspica]|uniref:Uncharacterized protein n=1 Tax=Panacagrimonas perspica TaxID=381431 RepID=A0A4R7PBD1_9GAMM|nr:hypothetical protein [Panacagrimonas perspica]TDU31297.1 hypothetical protein DFR24_0661 [Panacagrimonas perspica]THD02639.1 hypothetical protein B1810_13935 [Panacagrimonas perspica]
MNMQKPDVRTRGTESKTLAPLPQGVDTSESVSGGPEDLMVQDLGGTLPLKKSEVPHYLEKASRK